MDGKLIQLTYCFYIDTSRNEYFCVTDFIRHHDWPDTANMRHAIAAQIKEKSPDVLILEEQN